MTFIQNIKKDGQCSICGESDWRCLDFHHRNNDRVHSFSQIASRGWAMKRVVRELAKCDLVCVNCHRKIHMAP